MTTSQTPFLSEIADPFATIPSGKLAYLESRVRHAFHDYILGKFELKQKEGLTKAILAKRLGRDAAQVHRYLATPNNLTLDTVTILLAAIAAEELQPHSTSLLNRAPQNFDASLERINIAQTPSQQSRTSTGDGLGVVPRKDPFGLVFS